MVFERIQSAKLSQSVVRQIEQLILRGIVRPGERLPPERELAERMGVSRPSLREAFADLQERGLLQSRAGSGVYVSESLGSVFSKAMIDLFASHEEALFDFIAFRRDIEGLAAERAARLASDTDLEVINTRFERMVASAGKRNPKENARLDAEFHMAILEASHNVIMLHMMQAMFDLLREGVFYNRQVMFSQQTTREALLDQHRAINSALQSRDAKGARAAIEAHLGFIEQALQAQRQREKNENVARMRLNHERSRSG